MHWERIQAKLQSDPDNRRSILNALAGTSALRPAIQSWLLPLIPTMITQEWRDTDTEILLNRLRKEPRNSKTRDPVIRQEPVEQFLDRLTNPNSQIRKTVLDTLFLEKQKLKKAEKLTVDSRLFEYQKTEPDLSLRILALRTITKTAGTTMTKIQSQAHAALTKCLIQFSEIGRTSTR